MRSRAALSRALEPALGLFLAACFILPTEATYSLVFYLAVVPCALARAAPPPWLQPSAVWAGVAMIAWSAATLCWGEDTGGRAARFALASAATLVFWLAAYDVLTNQATRGRLQTLLIALGAASAAISGSSTIRSRQLCIRDAPWAW